MAFHNIQVFLFKFNVPLPSHQVTSTRAFVLHVRYYVLVVGFHLFPLCSRHSACFLSLILSSFTSTASDGPSAFINPEFVSGYPAHQHVQHYLLLQQDWCRVNSSICSCRIQGSTPHCRHRGFASCYRPQI